METGYSCTDRETLTATFLEGTCALVLTSRLISHEEEYRDGIKRNPIILSTLSTMTAQSNLFR